MIIFLLCKAQNLRIMNYFKTLQRSGNGIELLKLVYFI
jgi:hypothetical protein